MASETWHQTRNLCTGLENYLSGEGEGAKSKTRSQIVLQKLASLIKRLSFSLAVVDMLMSQRLPVNVLWLFKCRLKSSYALQELDIWSFGVAASSYKAKRL